MIQCSTCQAEVVPSGCGTGYALLPDGKKICYPCADKQQRQEVADSKPGDSFWAYANCDGTHITTWTGGRLMRITHAKTDYSTFGHRTYHYWARDLEKNRRWYGRNAGSCGGNGCCIRLRLLKED